MTATGLAPHVDLLFFLVCRFVFSVLAFDGIAAAARARWPQGLRG